MPEPHEDAEPLRRRRARRRATAQQGPPQVARPADVPGEQGARDAGRRKQPRERDAKGRADRDLAGPGSSQVGPAGAMRARDLNRPTPEDLVQAEAELEIVRRHWTPTTDQPDQPRPVQRRR